MRLRSDVPLRMMLDTMNRMLKSMKSVNFSYYSITNGRELYTPMLDSFDVASMFVEIEPFELETFFDDKQLREYLDEYKLNVNRRKGMIIIDVSPLWAYLMINFGNRICYNVETEKLFIVRFYHRVFWGFYYWLLDANYKARINLRQLKRNYIKPRFKIFKIRVKVFLRRLRRLFKIR